MAGFNVKTARRFYGGKGRGGSAAALRAWAVKQRHQQPVSSGNPVAVTAAAAAGMVSAMPAAGSPSTETSGPSVTQVWGGTASGSQSLTADQIATTALNVSEPASVTPGSAAPSANSLANAGLAASPIKEAPVKGAGGGGAALGLGAAGFLVGGPIGGLVGLALGAVMGKKAATAATTPKTGSEAQAGLAAAQAASVRAQQIDAVEQSSRKSVAQLQGLMGF